VDATVAHTRARHAGLKRRRQPDDPDVTAAKRDLEAAKLAAHVQRIVDASPPLTDEQRNRITTLLRPRGVS